MASYQNVVKTQTPKSKTNIWTFKIKTKTKTLTFETKTQVLRTTSLETGVECMLGY